MAMAEPVVNDEGLAPVDVDDALADVQRLVVSAFAHLPWARYHLMRIDPAADVGAARRWLAEAAIRTCSFSKFRRNCPAMTIPPRATTFFCCGRLWRRSAVTFKSRRGRSSGG